MTSVGGPYGYGTIFKLTPAGALTTLYNFGTASNDGANPSSLIQGGDGNFYGTTQNNHQSTASINGFGTVFKITPSGELTTIYSFCLETETGVCDGYPGTLIQGADGNIYGTASGGYYGGTFFKITPTGTLTTLYGFADGSFTDGSNPEGPLFQGADGNFYGTTSTGGINPCGSVFSGCGTVFKITPEGTLTKLYAFGATPADGTHPQSGVVQATDGNFYGTTTAGGATGNGTVFRITPSGALTILYSFTHGCSPTGVLVQAGDGNLYGTNSGSTVAAPSLEARSSESRWMALSRRHTIFALNQIAPMAPTPAG